MKWIGAWTFSGLSPSGNEMIIDSLPEFGGDGRAATPMEMLLGSVIGCTGIDILSILEKMKQTPSHFQVDTKGDRAESYPRRFKKIHLHYAVSGDVSENGLRRAIELSINKYCSVTYSLNAKIVCSYSLNNEAEKTIELD